MDGMPPFGLRSAQKIFTAFGVEPRIIGTPSTMWMITLRTCQPRIRLLEDFF